MSSEEKILALEERVADLLKQQRAQLKATASAPERAGEKDEPSSSAQLASDEEVGLRQDQK